MYIKLFEFTLNFPLTHTHAPMAELPWKMLSSMSWRRKLTVNDEEEPAKDPPTCDWWTPESQLCSMIISSVVCYFPFLSNNSFYAATRYEPVNISCTQSSKMTQMLHRRQNVFNQKSIFQLQMLISTGKYRQIFEHVRQRHRGRQRFLTVQAGRQVEQTHIIGY